MRIFLTIAALLAGAASSPAEPPVFRIWTDTRQQKIEAVFVREDGKGVILASRDGKEVTVPLANLSDADRAWISSQTSPGEEASTDRPPALAEWPRTVTLPATPAVKVVREDAEKKEYIYETGHYEFVCDSPLGANLVREFSRIFEATWRLNCELPLDFKPEPEEGREKFRARLFTHDSDYRDAGGPPGSAGVYMREEKMLALPISSLGVKMFGARVTVDYGRREYGTLIHEITHQTMNHWLHSLPLWYIEGSAEYVELMKYDNGRFSLLQHEKLLRERLAAGGRFPMLPLETLMRLRSREWLAAVASEEGARENYASSLALTYFFYHIDGDGKGTAFREYLRAIEKLRNSASPATGAPETPASLVDRHLLRGRSYEALEGEVRKGLRRLGITVEFAR